MTDSPGEEVVSDPDSENLSVDGGWVPVAIVHMDGESGWLAVEVSTKEQFACLYDEVLDAWEPPPADPSLTVTPDAYAPPYLITFAVMTRGEVERLPEFGGW